MMYNIKIPISENGSRFDRCIRRLLGNINQANLEKSLRLGQILLDNKKTKSSTKVISGETIYYSAQIKFNNYNKKQSWNELTKKYYDELYKQILIKHTKEYIAFNKPNGLAVQGGSTQKYHINDMLRYLFKNTNIPKLVHRIDKDTSGLLIVAKNQVVAKKFSKYFREKKIIKTYLAIVSPSPMTDSGVIDFPLLKNGRNGQKKMIIDRNKGKIATTEYKVIDKVNSRVALLALYPKTGRTHQLRVHLEYIKSPIVGDKKYNGLSDVCSSNSHLLEDKNISQVKWNDEGIKGIKNLQLHAYSINMPPNEIIKAEVSENFKKNIEFFGLTLPKNLHKIFTR